MNNKLRLLLVIVITTFLVSCGNRNSLITNISFNGFSSVLIPFLWNGTSEYETSETTSDPTVEEVAKKYMIAIEKARFDEAKTLVTDESKATIDMMTQLFEMGGEEAKKVAAQAKVEVKEMNCVTNDTIADCSCKVNNGKEDKQTSIRLIKKDGKWLVEQKKESVNVEEATPNLNADSSKAK